MQPLADYKNPVAPRERRITCARCIPHSFYLRVFNWQSQRFWPSHLRAFLSPTVHICESICSQVISATPPSTVSPLTPTYCRVNSVWACTSHGTVQTLNSLHGQRYGHTSGRQMATVRTSLIKDHMVVVEGNCVPHRPVFIVQERKAENFRIGPTDYSAV